MMSRCKLTCKLLVGLLLGIGNTWLGLVDANAQIPRRYDAQPIRIPDIGGGEGFVRVSKINNAGQLIGSSIRYSLTPPYQTGGKSYFWRNQRKFKLLPLMRGGRTFFPEGLNDSGVMFGSDVNPELDFSNAAPILAIPHRGALRYVQLDFPRSLPPPPNDGLSVRWVGNRSVDQTGVFYGYGYGDYEDIREPLGKRTVKKALKWAPPFYEPQEVQGTERRCAELRAVSTQGVVLTYMKRTQISPLETSCYIGDERYFIVSNGQSVEIPELAGAQHVFWSAVNSAGDAIADVVRNGERGLAVYQNGQTRFLSIAAQIQYANFFPLGLNDNGLVLVRAYNELFTSDSMVYLVDIRSGEVKDINSLLARPLAPESGPFPLDINDQNQIVVAATNANGEVIYSLLTPR